MVEKEEGRVVRDFERDDLDYRRSLSTDEKVDLLLDRFLGNRLKGTVGQTDVLRAIDDHLRGVDQRLEETNQRLVDVTSAAAMATAERNILRQRLDKQMEYLMTLMIIIIIEAFAIIYLLSQVWA